MDRNITKQMKASIDIGTNNGITVNWGRKKRSFNSTTRRVQNATFRERGRPQ